MTVEQVIKETQVLLRNINIPVGLIEQIGFPINGAINNLQLCLDAFEEQKKGQEQEQTELAEKAEEIPVCLEEIGGEENQ